MRVPLVDLSAQHAEVADEVAAGMREVLERSSYILGPAVSEFEASFAAFSGVGHCIGVANGTDALELAVRALDIGPGDEVILPANTFIATALAVLRAGARPVLVDVDPVHLLIDPEAAEAAVNERTRAIIPVHLYGQMAPMDRILEVARARNLAVIEDAAQAQGAAQGGVPAGGAGAIAGMSFYPSKNLGAAGDAGAVLTDDPALAARVRALRNYGSETKYEHPEIGFNSRLDSLQAVVLSAKLRHLERWNDMRRGAAAAYAVLLGDHERITLPGTADGNEHVWYVYVVRVARRDEVLATLNAAGVGAGVHYPIPIHLQPPFARFGYREGMFPVAEQSAREILSLPIYPHISEEQQVYVAEQLRKALT